MGLAEEYLNKAKQEQAQKEEDETEEEEDDDEENEGDEEVESIEDPFKIKADEEEDSDIVGKKEVRRRKIIYKWWIKPSITYAFRHPLVTSRLEKLMGSNCVSLTDRDYMQKLQQRILEEYANSAEKRIKAREMDEMERVKNLVLTGKMPFSNAPPEMYDHPVMVIERYCQKLIAARRAKIKVPKVNIPNHLYWDDTIDPPSGLSIEKGHMFRGAIDRICIPPERFIEIDDNEDIGDGYMLTELEFQKMKYVDQHIRELRECETVEELYRLSDEVIGNLKTMEGRTDEEVKATD